MILDAHGMVIVTVCGIAASGVFEEEDPGTRDDSIVLSSLSRPGTHDTPA